MCNIFFYLGLCCCGFIYIYVYNRREKKSPRKPLHRSLRGDDVTGGHRTLVYKLFDLLSYHWTTATPKHTTTWKRIWTYRWIRFTESVAISLTTTDRTTNIVTTPAGHVCGPIWSPLVQTRTREMAPPRWTRLPNTFSKLCTSPETNTVASPTSPRPSIGRSTWSHRQSPTL